uniref:Uncharacterized protein n=1 Tax=Tanacetum cinerariifolium TaxID=118510 RepID=A0A6L2K888_TANCI|nr:hypothetical protein [Tanacetum cinerariifolium]
MVQGINGEFNFLSEEGLDENQGSLSAKSMDNETPMINAKPISAVYPSNVAENIIDSYNTSPKGDELSPVGPSASPYPEAGKKSKAMGRRKLTVDALRDEFPSARELEDTTDCHWVVAHAEIKTLQGQVSGLYNVYSRLVLEEKKWINYEKTLSLLPAKVEAVVTKVVPGTTTKLVHSDEMGVPIARLVKASIIHGKCVAFEEVAEIKEPFVLEKMLGYRPFLKEEYD